MKNNILYFILFFFIFPFKSIGAEQFNFDVTEIQILDNGNKFIGTNRGVINVDSGIVINADMFEYDKKRNTLITEGNVKVTDITNDNVILTNKATYFKNDEIIFTEGNSEALIGNIVINADMFEYDKKRNTLITEGNVKVTDTTNDNVILTNKATYFKNDEIIFTEGNSEAFIGKNEIDISAENFEYQKLLNNFLAKNNVMIFDRIENNKINSEFIEYKVNDQIIFTEGKTTAEINNEYFIETKDLKLNRILNELTSNEDTQIKDKNNLYNLSKFKLLINKEELKGENIVISTNYNLPSSDKFFFLSAIIDLKNQDFIAQDTKIKIHKSVFDNSDNDPRIEGVSSKKNGEKTLINKAIFTSCEENDSCPPWSIQANKIIHDKNKKQIIYKDAILKVYNAPVLYFPKFFHPDPTVERQSGFLKPAINNSNVLGNSVTLPYFKVIADNKDITFTPTFFDTNNTIMAQNEYRQKSKYSSFLADFGIVKDYKSPTIKKDKNLFHLFSEFNLDLNLEQFQSSKLFLSIEKVTNDTYLKVFDTHITKSELRPENINKLNNQLKLNLNNESYNLETGIETFEDLQLSKTDRYQYILPYYKYNNSIDQNIFNGSINFASNGSNSLSDTNNLKSNVINDLNYKSQNYVFNSGIESTYNIALKNLNSVGKKNTEYKSSPQIELVSMLNADFSLPLIKKSTSYTNILKPRASFRFNPNDMKNYSSSDNKIDNSNIFSNNRLGFSDTLEAGRSLTVGVDFKNEKKNLDNINKYFELKLATVLRDKEEKFIPRKSTINRKNSNIFGSVTNNFSEKLNINYNFALDNDFNTFEYNDFNATFSLNNLVTKFNFIQEDGEMGDLSVLENSIEYDIDEKNALSFKTRRNRRLNLTEYYDLVYEYKNDCLTAGIKYKKSYYEDRDLKPTENLLFTLTLFPLTTYEYEGTDLIKN